MIKVFKDNKWEIIADRTGVKFRVEEDTLQFYHSGEWHEVSGSMKVAPVSNASVTANDEGNMITATWNNPTNEEYSRTEVYISKSKIATTNPEVIIKQAEKIYSGSEETISKEAKQGEKLYVYFLAVHNIAGLDVYSDIVELDVTPVDKVPPAPATLLKVVSTDKTNKLTWKNPVDKDFKHTQINFKTGNYPTGISDGTKLTTTNEESYTHGSLVNDTKYFYRLFTVDEAGNANTDTSMQAQGTPVSISSATFVNNTQTLDGEKLTVNWKKGARAISTSVFSAKKDINNFTYEQCVSDISVKQEYKGSNETVTFDTTTESTYFVKLFTEQIYGGENIHDKGITEKIVTKDKQPPASVTGFTAVGVNTEVELSWKNPVDKDFKQVILYWKMGSKPEIAEENVLARVEKSESYTHSNLINGQKYFYIALTEDKNGNINTQEITAEATPLALVSIKSFKGVKDLAGEKVTLTWVNPTEPFIHVKVFKSLTDITNKSVEEIIALGSGAESVYEGKAQTVTTNTTPNKNYYFKGFAKQESGSKQLYDTGVSTTVLTTDEKPPANVTNIKAIATDKKVTLSWKNPSDSDFSKVKIIRKEGAKPSSVTDGTAIYEGALENYVDTSVTNTKTYYYRWFAYDKNENVNSQDSMFTQATPDSMKNVTELKGVPTKNGETINISWVNPSIATEVAVFASLTDMQNMTHEQAVASGTLVHRGLGTTGTFTSLPEKNYYIKAFAKQVYGEKEVYDNGVQITVYTKDNEPPKPITNFKVVSAEDGVVNLSWTNPADKDFANTTIRYKTGSYPTSITDGTQGYKGKATTAKITNLVDGTKYFFRAFTTDTNNNTNSTTTGMQLTATPIELPKHKTYTVIIDETNSNPETALTYADDAINLQPKSDEFLEFLGAKPCLLKEGKVVGYLNPNDFSKFEDGSTADITSGNAGDVMIEFPKRGIKIERKGTNLHVSMTDELGNADFSYMAHKKGTQEVDNIYIGAYKAFVSGGKMRSLSGKTPTASKTIGAFRTEAQANGEGYQQSQWYHLVYRQVAYVLYAKNLDSQTAIGRGYVDGNSSALTTGSTDKLGMIYGETTGKKSVKVFGIEDFWGNVFEWIDGLATSSSRDILITKNNSDYNDAGNGYQQYGKCFTKSSYIDKVVGDKDNGFLPETTNGSETTYYADYAYQSSSGGRVVRFGGSWSGASAAGAFCLGVYDAPFYSGSAVSARLSFS